MKIRLVSLEDGITSCGFRKLAAYVRRLEPGTDVCYVSTGQRHTLGNALRGTMGGKPAFDRDQIDEIAQCLAGADVVGFSSMTGYADLTRAIITRLRVIDPSAYLVWGGIHPIIQPEDAIRAPVDAICTGEGEFAFEEVLSHLQAGTDPRASKNFWFRDGDDDASICRNAFLPLMTPAEMETLPFPIHRDRERLYRVGQGLTPMSLGDYLANDGLGHTTLWSIGCPFHCSFCGNTKFIANDARYKRIRHPSAQYMVDQIKAVRARSPHLSQVSFGDDSFMAIPYSQIAEFAERWKAEVDLPFAVYGVIPNYVKRDKFEVLTWAGMNRVRMGIQSGSKAILDFYQRPTPPEKILAAAEVIASFSPEYHIPPAYDVIVDNPIETRQDVIDTLSLLHAIARPFTLYIYSLKVIPNTRLEELLRDRGLDVEEIDRSYLVIPARWANLLLYLLCLWRPPASIFRLFLRRVRACGEPQKLYPKLGLVLRFAYIAKRALDHLRFMDFSITPGWIGYGLWRLGIVRTWQRRFVKQPPKPAVQPERPRKTVPSTSVTEMPMRRTT